MREVILKVFSFSELSEQAKERAKQDFAEDEGYTNGRDALESLKALAEHFGGRLRRYEIDWFNTSYSSAAFDMPNFMSASEIRSLLQQLGSYNRKTLKGHGDCKLTGYCADEDAIDGFRTAFLKDKITDLAQLMQAAFESWLKACQKDCESQYEDEAFGETSDANNWDYTKAGKLFIG